MIHFIWPVITERPFSLPLTKIGIHFGQNVCDALSYLLVNIYIRFGTTLYGQIVGIPMGTNCAPLVADLFYTATKKISWIHEADVIEVFIFFSTSRYLDDLLNIDNSILKVWSIKFIHLS